MFFAGMNIFIFTIWIPIIYGGIPNFNGGHGSILPSVPVEPPNQAPRDDSTNLTKENIMDLFFPNLDISQCGNCSISENHPCQVYYEDGQACESLVWPSHIGYSANEIPANPDNFDAFFKYDNNKTIMVVQWTMSAATPNKTLGFLLNVYSNFDEQRWCRTFDLRQALPWTAEDVINIKHVRFTYNCLNLTIKPGNMYIVVLKALPPLNTNPTKKVITALQTTLQTETTKVVKTTTSPIESTTQDTTIHIEGVVGIAIAAIITAIVLILISICIYMKLHVKKVAILCSEPQEECQKSFITALEQFLENNFHCKVKFTNDLQDKKDIDFLLSDADYILIVNICNPDFFDSLNICYDTCKKELESYNNFIYSLSSTISTMHEKNIALLQFLPFDSASQSYTSPFLDTNHFHLMSDLENFHMFMKDAWKKMYHKTVQEKMNIKSYKNLKGGLHLKNAIEDCIKCYKYSHNIRSVSDIVHPNNKQNEKESMVKPQSLVTDLTNMIDDINKRYDTVSSTSTAQHRDVTTIVTGHSV